MRSLWRTVALAPVRDIALVCLADGVVGLSFGAISVAGGLPAWVPIAMSLLIFAGGAQFSAVAIVLAGGGPVAAVVAGLVLNARLLPFGFAAADVLEGGWPRKLLGAQLMIDESVAFTLAQREPARRKAAYWTCGLGLYVIWNLAVAAGTFAGKAVGDTNTYGLDAAFPAVLFALVLPMLRTKGTARPAVVGTLIALAATPFLPPGVPVLLALLGLLTVGKADRPGTPAMASGAAT
ncbi:MAG TPA: AzlC family ABC transporter permease [Pseudonocardiaceae bacterium]|jgi:4-azaleucine resistance transporter AzlC|nr:AzlC family ABC transporter permease [Pseudonocardiaceae bacterium]